MKSLVILGRQPVLGLAELESLYGAEAITVIGRGGALIDIDSGDINFARLGGSVKLARVLHTLDTTNWEDIEEYLKKSIPEHLKHVKGGKLQLGLSTFGLRVRPKEINGTGLRLKKIIKSKGHSVRVIPNKSPALNSAQVLHNQLIGQNGWELVLARFGDKTILAQTTAEQNIEAYARRDQNRPMRDARVGMLPPKLAQILINLTNTEPGSRILDPFCGTGVVLQEAALMGYRVYGTDIDERMAQYSRDNLEWLKKSHGINFDWTVEVGDATSYAWQEPVHAVAGETYLGRPLSTKPPQKLMEQIIGECDKIHNAFLQNLSTQLNSGDLVCLGVPAWKSKNGFLHLKTLDLFEELGYTRKSFVHARNEELIYHRPDQIVARELIVLEKK